MFKRGVLLSVLLVLVKKVSAVRVFGTDYSLTVITPIVLIIIVLLGFLIIYIKDNWKRFKIPGFHKKHKQEKKEEKEIDFSAEFLRLQKSINKQTNDKALDSISDLTKEFIRSKINLIGEFSLGEVPRERLSKSTQEFIDKISELKYAGKEVRKENVTSLMNSLSSLLRTHHISFKTHEKKKRITFKLPKFKFPKIKFPKISRKKFAPQKISAPKPAKHRLPKEKPFELREVERLNDKILRLIRKVESNLNRPNRAIRLYEKAVEVNKLIPNSKLTPKLKELNKIFLKYRERQDKIKEDKIKVQNEIKINKLSRKINERIIKSERSIQNSNKSLWHYERAVKLYNKLSDKSKFTSKLKELHNKILDTKQKSITKELKAIVPKKEEVKNKETDKLNESVQILIKKIEKNIPNTNKALKIYQKAVGINNLIHNSKLTPRLNELHKRIFNYRKDREEKIKKVESENVRVLKEAKLKKFKDRVLEVIKASENNVTNYNKSIRLYQKATKLNKRLPQHDFSSRLKTLQNRISDNKNKEINLKRNKEINKIKERISKLIKESENNIHRYGKSIRLYKKAERIYNTLPEKHGFTSKLNELRDKIESQKEKLKQVTPEKEEPKETVRKEIKPEVKKRHIKRKPLFYNLKLRLKARKVLNLIKAADAMTIRNPVISKKIHDQALMMYYELPLEQEDKIAAKLSKYYDKIHGPKELIEYKKNDLHKTQKALKEYHRYRNYIVLEEQKRKHKISKHIEEIKQHTLKTISKTKDRTLKKDLIRLLRKLKRKDDKIKESITEDIDSLHKIAHKITSRIARKVNTVREFVSGEEHDLAHSIKELFKHLETPHKLPQVHRPIMDIPKPRIPEPITNDIKNISEPEIPKEAFQKPRVITPKPKVNIKPPKLPEKDVPESIKKLRREKEILHNKLKSLDYQDDVISRIRNQ
jgi:hypothetical protein